MSLKALVCSVLALPMFLVTTSLIAAPVTLHYTAEIQTVSGSGWQSGIIGSTVSWTTTYDDASTDMHWYDNGPNGIDDHGAGDDTVNSTFTALSSGDLSFTADATTDVSALFAFVTDPSALVDMSGLSFDNIFEYDGNGRLLLDVQSDKYSLELKYSGVDDSDLVAAFKVYYDDVGTLSSSLVLNNVVASPVPVPAAFWLFSSGLIGLIVRNVRNRLTSVL